MTRALFVNSGMLGHGSFAAVLERAVGLIPWIDASHIDLSRDLTTADRVIRRVLSVRLTPSAGPAMNLDLCRWRQELNVGLLAARRIRAAERRAPFDVLHFHTQATAYASIARLRRTPSVVSLDCTQRLASLQAPSRVARATYRAGISHDGRVFRAAAAIVATSNWAARDLADRYPVCAARVHVIPFPVDVDAFPPSWIAERAERARDGRRLPARVLFMGGDFERKGGPELLEAWHAGGFAGCAELDLVTDWPLAADGLPPGVRVVAGVRPYTDRWLDLWRRADLFVMPARDEAFGIVYEEAAASGIPAIGPTLNAVPEIVQDGVSGLLVPRGDRDALVRSLRTLLDDPALRQRMGAAGRQHVSQRAAVPVYAARLGSIIESLVNDDVRKRA